MTIAATRTPGGAFALSDGGVRLKVNKWDTLGEGVHWFIDYTTLFFDSGYVHPSTTLFNYGIPDNAFYYGLYGPPAGGVYVPTPTQANDQYFPWGWVIPQGSFTAPPGYVANQAEYVFTPGSRWTRYSTSSAGSKSKTYNLSGTISTFPYSAEILSTKDYQGTSTISGGPTVWRPGMSTLSTYLIIKFNTNKTVTINGSAKSVTGGIPYLVNSWHTETPRTTYGTTTTAYYTGAAGDLFHPGPMQPQYGITTSATRVQCNFNLVVTVS